MTDQLEYRKLTADQEAKLFPKRGHMDLMEYEVMLRECSIGDSMQIRLKGLTERAMKRRLGIVSRRVFGESAYLKYKLMSDPEWLAFIVRLRVDHRNINPTDKRLKHNKPGSL